MVAEKSKTLFEFGLRRPQGLAGEICALRYCYVGVESREFGSQEVLYCGNLKKVGSEIKNHQSVVWIEEFGLQSESGFRIREVSDNCELGREELRIKNHVSQSEFKSEHLKRQPSTRSKLVPLLLPLVVTFLYVFFSDSPSSSSMLKN